MKYKRVHYQEDIIQTVYAPNNRASWHMKKNPYLPVPTPGSSWDLPQLVLFSLNNVSHLLDFWMLGDFALCPGHYECGVVEILDSVIFHQ